MWVGAGPNLLHPRMTAFDPHSADRSSATAGCSPGRHTVRQAKSKVPGSRAAAGRHAAAASPANPNLAVGLGRRSLAEGLGQRLACGTTDGAWRVSVVARRLLSDMLSLISYLCSFLTHMRRECERTHLTSPMEPKKTTTPLDRLPPNKE